ncbi:Tautomerase enzyme [Acididesulfobacillus acetoxydans]|uniref:Interconverting Keto-and Enol-Groups n=1 Tax=Acididesulfobacillus acetoxydans TaxID=1561005 RepID=A0A8S0WMM8_9FIRM|nr:4-oxalocrotonate tautomerase DmpI [Acididesulfobacillus acetoxydans]CAA7600674.1 Tautomerase enzyme [Acididesulfobacillus acetoxydans]CEJ09455.1 Interconverting Keto-and Enol-Groups [Acididesulfobacillus acetoxydans]
MPTIHFDGPALTIDQKRSLIHGMTQAASQALGLPMAAFNVVLDEHERSNMGVGGELLAESPFYEQRRDKLED